MPSQVMTSALKEAKRRGIPIGRADPARRESDAGQGGGSLGPLGGTRHCPRNTLR